MEAFGGLYVQSFAAQFPESSRHGQSNDQPRRSRLRKWCLIRSPRDLDWTLCGDGGDGHLRVFRVLVGDLGEAAFGEDVQADVAAHLGPFVMLLGEHGADQADQRGPVRKDADDVGAAADLAVQPFLVESAWGAVSVLRPIRFPGRPPNRTCPFPSIRLRTVQVRSTSLRATATQAWVWQ